jgi:hypothetical protein
MSANPPPFWLRAVHRLERAIGEPVEWAVRSDPYFDTVTAMNRVHRKARGTLEELSRRGLHLLNLPAGTDVRRLREQLSRMERRLNHLAEGVEELQDVHHRSSVG